jgi:hypothetical protein
MNRMSIRVGGILVPVFALLAGCASGMVGGGGSGTTEDALGSENDGNNPPKHGGEDAAAPCDDAGAPVAQDAATPPVTAPNPPCDDDASAPREPHKPPTPPAPPAPPCDDAAAPPAPPSPPPPAPPCDDASAPPVVADAAPTVTPDAGSCQVGAYDGRATGLDVKIGVTAVNLDGNLLLSDTGPLPAAGGVESAHVLNLAEANLATIGVLDAKTSGGGETTTSTSSVTGVALTVNGLDIAANVLSAHAVALCDGSGAAVTGGADIVGLTIAGKAIVVTGFPNQTINLGLATIVINEVSKASASHGGGEIDVAALHVSAPNVADVVVSAASAGITCTCDSPAPTPPITNPPTCGTSMDCAEGESCYNGGCTNDY